MDQIPDRLLNPPAIVYQLPDERQAQAPPSRLEIELNKDPRIERPEKKISLIKTAAGFIWNQITHSGPQVTRDEYIEKLCENWGWALQHFVYHRPIYDPSNSIPKLRGSLNLHVAKHVSLFDVVVIPHNLYRLGMEKIAPVSRENMQKLPIFGNAFANCPIIEIPFGGIEGMDGRPFIRKVNETLREERSPLLWAEGGRGPNDEVLPLKEPFIRIVQKYAKSRDMRIMVAPQALVYDRVIEETPLPLLQHIPFLPDRIKDLTYLDAARYFKQHYNRWLGRKAYHISDLASFGTRLARNLTLKREGGIVAHVFAEPFDIRDCRDASEVCKIAHQRISEQQTYFYGRLRNWS